MNNELKKLDDDAKRALIDRLSANSPKPKQPSSGVRRSTRR